MDESTFSSVCVEISQRKLTDFTLEKLMEGLSVFEFVGAGKDPYTVLIAAETEALALAL